MARRTYKNKLMQRMYDALYAWAANADSTLYIEGRPHTGAGHRCAFWDGAKGLERGPHGSVPMSQGWAARMAGKDRATHPVVMAAIATEVQWKKDRWKRRHVPC